jgi:hemerythrin
MGIGIDSHTLVHTLAAAADKHRIMSYIDWTPDYDLGIEEIDRQHRRLVEVVNRLHDAMEQGCPKAAMQGVVCDLVTYTEIHFRYEEQLMNRLGYRGRDAHVLEHRKLSAELNEFELALAGGRLCVSLELMEFLKAWLPGHVGQADRALAEHALGLRGAGALALCG